MEQLTVRHQTHGSRVQTTWAAITARTPALPCPAGMDYRRLRLPTQTMPLTPDTLLLPMDMLRDSRSFAGVCLAASPYLDFARRLLADPLLVHPTTDYHRSAGRLPEHSDAGLAWGPDQDCAEFAYLIRCLQQGWYEPDAHEPVVLAELRDGRHMVLSGLRVLAAAVALGWNRLEVQIAPENEVRAGVRQHLRQLTPRPLFRRNLALADALGSPPGHLHPDAMRMAREIAAAPLVGHGHVYQPLPFPEFANLASQADDLATYQRLGMILDLCPEPRGMRYLDLGCNLGFYDFSLARRGALVTGLDRDDRFVAAARRVAAIKGVAAEFVAAPLEPALFAAGGILGDSRPVWDLVTCFSTLQWVVRDHGEEFAIELLQAISGRSKALLIDIPVNCGNPRLSATPGLELCRMADLIHASCGYPHCRYVGTVAPYKVDRRHVFHCFADG
ncbi:MAG: methyltransferase domain-containing protein [Vicinamibacterales bacterium]|nr:methyltransferase domain-containing protein [Vicinamibacterales bacterium]